MVSVGRRVSARDCGIGHHRAIRREDSVIRSSPVTGIRGIIRSYGRPMERADVLLFPPP